MHKKFGTDQCGGGDSRGGSSVGDRFILVIRTVMIPTFVVVPINRFAHQSQQMHGSCMGFPKGMVGMSNGGSVIVIVVATLIVMLKIWMMLCHQGTIGLLKRFGIDGKSTFDAQYRIIVQRT